MRLGLLDSNKEWNNIVLGWTMVSPKTVNYFIICKLNKYFTSLPQVDNILMPPFTPCRHFWSIFLYFALYRKQWSVIYKRRPFGIEVIFFFIGVLNVNNWGSIRLTHPSMHLKPESVNALKLQKYLNIVYELYTTECKNIARVKILDMLLQSSKIIVDFIASIAHW